MNIQNKDNIDLFYFDGCPSWRNALTELELALKSLGLSRVIKLVHIVTDADARVNRFVGSPTIRIDGEDLFPVDHTDFALGCRLYTTPEGMRGWPSSEMIRVALAEQGLLHPGEARADQMG
ncbi:MAG: hypothetical protein V3T55_05050 [Anaerolineales bacterium]